MRVCFFCPVQHGSGKGLDAENDHLEMRDRKSSDCSDGEDGAAARWDVERKFAAGFDDEPPAHPNTLIRQGSSSATIHHGHGGHLRQAEPCSSILQLQPLTPASVGLTTTDAQARGLGGATADCASGAPGGGCLKNDGASSAGGRPGGSCCPAAALMRRSPCPMPGDAPVAPTGLPASAIFVRPNSLIRSLLREASPAAASSSTRV